jgi:hypothetical protein
MAAAQGARTLPRARFAPDSAEAAAALVETYFSLVEAGRYAPARALYGDKGERSGKTSEEFAADYRRYRDYHAEIGNPGRIEGAAGSLYVAVPVRVHGRLADGTPIDQKGEATVRRVNGNIPGATAEQRRWHLNDIALGEAEAP